KRQANGVLPVEVLQALAARMRTSGMCLSLLRCDGTFCWTDTQAGLFFTRYAIPSVQFVGPGEVPLPDRITALKSDADRVVWEQPAGVLVAAVPIFERKRIIGIFVLSARGKSFGATEDVMRV